MSFSDASDAGESVEAQRKWKHNQSEIRRRSRVNSCFEDLRQLLELDASASRAQIIDSAVDAVKSSDSALQILRIHVKCLTENANFEWSADKCTQCDGGKCEVANLIPKVKIRKRKQVLDKDGSEYFSTKRRNSTHLTSDLNILDSAPLAMCLIDCNGVLIKANDMFIALYLGTDGRNESISNVNLFDFVEQNCRSSFLSALQKVSKKLSNVMNVSENSAFLNDLKLCYLPPTRNRKIQISLSLSTVRQNSHGKIDTSKGTEVWNEIENENLVLLVIYDSVLLNC